MDKKIYGLKIKSEQERMESQSGGAFYCMAKKVILNGGVVYGVILNESMLVGYSRATTLEEILPMRGSKYVQTKVGNTFKNVLEDLKKGNKVLFSGTPCCVNGLLLFLEQARVNMDNLVTCDLVCHGVASPLIFQEFIQYVSNGNLQKVKDFRFRDKCKGWHSHFETYYIDKKYCTNIYAKLFSSGNCLRESCYICKYTNYDRISDITIGDFWGIEKSHPELDDNKGISLLMVNSEKGRVIFEDIKNDVEFFESNKKEISQPQLHNPFCKATTYDEFWNDYQKRQFKYIVFKYGRGGYKGILKSYVINITTKVGVYKLLHNMWMKIKR